MPNPLSRAVVAVLLVAGAAHAQPADRSRPTAPAAPPAHAGPPHVPGGGGGRPSALSGQPQFGGRAFGQPGVGPGGFDRGRAPGGPGFDARRFGGGGPADAGRIGVRRFGDDGASRLGGPGRAVEPGPTAGPRVYRFGGDDRGAGGSFRAAPAQGAPRYDDGRGGGADPRGVDRRGSVGRDVGGRGFDGRSFRGFGGRGFNGGGAGYGGRDHARFRVSPYRFPRGFRYRTYRRGEFFPRGLLLTPYFLDDYADFYLSPPPASDYRWVRYGPDALLIDVDTGEVVDEAYGVFDDGQAYGSGAYPYGGASDGNGYAAPPAYDGRGYDAGPDYGADDADPRGS